LLDALFQIEGWAKGVARARAHAEALVIVRVGKIEGDFAHLTGYVTARA
jgi:hypothetical protein